MVQNLGWRGSGVPYLLGATHGPDNYEKFLFSEQTFTRFLVFIQIITIWTGPTKIAPFRVNATGGTSSIVLFAFVNIYRTKLVYLVLRSEIFSYQLPSFGNTVSG